MWAASAAWVVLLAHVPKYDDACRNNCCTPPRAHTTSQVFYLRGSGGLEVHFSATTFDPFDIEGDEVIDVDAVFRDEIDPNTYDLYIGCGGCVASEDAIPFVESRVDLVGYQPAEVEPFTQTRYRSVLSSDQRKFNTSRLRNCTDAHFTIRLVDRIDRAEPIVWAPVIGVEERFTVAELLEFPVYILRNHGAAWNDLGYTYWIWLFAGAPLVVNGARLALTRAGVRVVHPYPCARAEALDPREPLYELALIGFVAAGLEELTHLLYAQAGAQVGYGLYVGLLVVILLAQGAGVLFTLLMWAGVRHRNDGWWTASPYWAPVEIAAGFGLLLLFGAGFFVGPVAIMVAGAIRLRELRRAPPAAAPASPPARRRPPRGSELGFLANESANRRSAR